VKGSLGGGRKLTTFLWERGEEKLKGRKEES